MTAAWRRSPRSSRSRPGSARRCCCPLLLRPRIGGGRADFRRRPVLLLAARVRVPDRRTRSRSASLLLLGALLPRRPAPLPRRDPRRGRARVHPARMRSPLALAVGLQLLLRFRAGAGGAGRRCRGGSSSPAWCSTAVSARRRLRVDLDRGRSRPACPTPTSRPRRPGGRSGCRDSAFTLFTPWLFAAHFWAERAVGVAGADVVGRAAARGRRRRLRRAAARAVRRAASASTDRLWAASYALYLLAVFFPQSSVFRLLMPMAPLAGRARAAVARRPARRCSWRARPCRRSGSGVCYGPFQVYWTVP